MDRRRPRRPARPEAARSSLRAFALHTALSTRLRRQATDRAGSAHNQSDRDGSRPTLLPVRTWEISKTSEALECADSGRRGQRRFDGEESVEMAQCQQKTVSVPPSVMLSLSKQWRRAMSAAFDRGAFRARLRLTLVSKRALPHHR